MAKSMRLAEAAGGCVVWLADEDGDRFLRQELVAHEREETGSPGTQKFRKPNFFVNQRVPTVLEWTESLDLIGDEDMFIRSPIGPKSSDFRCLSLNSFSFTLDGNYDRRRCNCSQGYEGNPYVNDGCQGIITIIAISAGFGLLFSLLGVAKITKKLKQRRAKKQRQKFFKRNHGLLLQHRKDEDFQLRRTGASNQ
ncbi:hypothetical protein EJB05_39952, partial [Eragrostis curvula]